MSHRRTVLLFAGAREAAGRDELTVTVEPGANARQVLRAIEQVAPELSGLLPSCRLVADEIYVDADQQVADAAQLALIPPVSGG